MTIMTRRSNRDAVLNFATSVSIGDITEHLVTMYDTIIGRSRVIGIRLIVELGVRLGTSTFVLSRAAEDVGAQNLIGVDIVDCSKCCDYNKWIFKQMDDLVFADVMKDVTNDRIDILFIDTVHTYEHTVNELKKFLPLMNKYGIIMMHDTWGVGPAIDFVFGIKGNWNTDFVIQAEKATIRHYHHNSGMAYIFLDIKIGSDKWLI